MLRTNQQFLNYIEQLYAQPHNTADIAVKSFAPGNVLLCQGEGASRVYIIKEGITKCYIAEENGKDFIVEFLGVGEIAGDLELIKKMNCLCSVEAITEVSAYVLSIPFAQLLLDTDIQFNHLLISEFADRVINTSSRSSFQQLYSMDHGLKKLLTLQAENNLELSKKDMASYLGITLRTLNRLLAGLEGGE